MWREERSFTLRFSLEAVFPDDYEGEDDQYAWIGEWEDSVKSEVVQAVFRVLRERPHWTARVRNRGRSEQDEIEILLERRVSGEPPTNPT